MWSIIAFTLWPKYMAGGSDVHPKTVVNHWILQKVLRINSHVPWPVHYTTRVLCPEKIQRGDKTPGITSCCHLDGRNGIVIGKNVWIGPRVSIISMNHDCLDYSKYEQVGPIIIGDNCWLATNAVILPEVVLGEHTVVAAGAVVTNPFPEGNVILGGVPAKVIKRLSSYNLNKRQ
jgi:acetyltransferase-like isoleucine patch superfamily enzyme